MTLELFALPNVLLCDPGNPALGISMGAQTQRGRVWVAARLVGVLGLEQGLGARPPGKQ